MAKSLRASRTKTNKTHLRAKVHQPVEDARIERLSAKLLELASKPKAEVKRPDADTTEETAQGDPDATEEANSSGPSAESKMSLIKHSAIPNHSIEMDIDRKLAKSKPRSGSIKVQKKRRSNVVFAVGKQHGKRRSGKSYQGPGVR